MKKILILFSFLTFCLKSSLYACIAEPEWIGGASFRIVQPLPAFDVDYHKSVMNETVDFWYAYLKKKVDRKDILDYFESYEEDEAVQQNPFAKAISNDNAAMRYLKACLALQRATGENWDYDDETDYLEVAKKAAEGLGDLPEVFAYRVALLEMRLCMTHDDYEGVRKVWQEKGQYCPDTALRKRLNGYYAAVLFNEEKYLEAIQIYNELGDQRSMDMCISKYVGYDGIKQLAEMSGEIHHTMLYYCLQDYANYYWSANINLWEDVVGTSPAQDNAEMLAEGKRLRELCVSMAEQGGADKIVWLSMIAWLDMGSGQYYDALNYAQQATNQKGTRIQKDNAERILMLARLYTAPVFDDQKYLKQLAADVLKLYERANAEIPSDVDQRDCSRYQRYYPSYCPNYCFLLGAYEPVLHSYLEKNQHNTQSVIILKNLCEQLTRKSGEGAESPWSQEWFTMLDENCNLEEATNFCDVVIKQKASDVFTQQLLKKFSCAPGMLYDLVGTKLMREGKYSLALTYFNKLDNAYLASTNYHCYLDERTAALDIPFVRSQYGSLEFFDDEDVDSEEFSMDGSAEKSVDVVNHKAVFCSDMVNRIHQLNLLTGDEKAKAEIEMAALMFQASSRGDLWALSEFGVTCDDTQQPNKLCAQARVQLNNALNDCQSEEVRFDAYYGLACVPTGEDFWKLQYDYSGENSTCTYKFTMFHPARTAYDYLVSHRNIKDLTESCDVLKYYAKQQ